MNLFTHLRLHNLTAPSALDVICSRETMREIIDALTPTQLVVAACLADGMAPVELARELEISRFAITSLCNMARQRVAGQMYHCNAEHLHGDVLARKRKYVTKQRPVTLCADCGCIIARRSTRCQRCSNVRTGRIRREEAA